MNYYWTYYIHPETGYSVLIHAQNTNSRIDQKRQQEKRVFNTEAAAKLALNKALAK